VTPYRIIYWQIDSTAHLIFYAAAGIAIAFFLAGTAACVFVWKKKAAASVKLSFSRDALKRAILDTFLGLRLFHGEIAAGTMHFLLFWGFLILFIGTVLMAAHEYMVSYLTGTVYLVYSLVMEVAGLMLLTGILWALIRRYVQRVPRLERRLEDALLPIWLLLVVITGYIVEGLQLAYLRPPWYQWSFVGWWIGSLFSDSEGKDLYVYLWWVHGLLSLGFIAAIPFTKLFHVLGAPSAIYFQGQKKPVEVMEGAGEFDLGDAIFFDACMRCGRCVQACPSAGAGEPFTPRDFVQAMRRSIWQKHSTFGDIRFLGRGEVNEVGEKFWYCTTCRACLEVCPVYGGAFEAAVKKRVLAVEEGRDVPKLVSQTLAKLSKYDNPWESSRNKRGAWAEGMDLVDLTKADTKTDICYFVGCTTSLEPTAQGEAQAFSRILQSAGVNFGILGKKEPCCGDVARRMGELGLFAEQRENSLNIFDEYGISDLVTFSPHCFNTFKNEYPEAPFRARHYTMVLRELMAGGKLRLKEGDEVTVTYHDPCYLGRYNRILDEPRQIISSIPGLKLVEMSHYGADSLCCGGGGGRMWQDLEGVGKMSQVRIREAEATGAQIVATACPLCRIMLEDARKAAGLNEKLRIMDLNELVLQALKAGDQ